MWTGEAVVPPGAWAPGTAFPRASVLVSYADMIAGAQYRTLTLPQLSVTVDLSLDVLLAGAPWTRVEAVTVESRILRRGKRTAITETTFSVGGVGPVAVCTGSFALISSTTNLLDGFDGSSPRPIVRVALWDEGRPDQQAADVTVGAIPRA